MPDMSLVERLAGWVKCWWHCLWRLHRMSHIETTDFGMHDHFETVWIGCGSCGETHWVRPGYEDAAKQINERIDAMKARGIK